MKRANNLYFLICDEENLRLAYQRAQKGKKLTKSALVYRTRADENLALLRQSLL